MTGPSEERPWPENAWPTAEEWLPWFLDQAPDEQLACVESMLRAAQEAGKCFEQNHAALLVDRAALAARLAEVGGEVERLREPFAQRERIERLIEASSLGSPEAKAARDRVPMEVGIAITKAADYLGRAERAEAERDAARAALGRVEALADEWDRRAAEGQKGIRERAAAIGHAPKFPAWITALRNRANETRAALRGEAGEGRA